MEAKPKEKAINLRQKGFSYSEILREVPVSKSTLSLWLRSVGLSKRQKQRLTEKRLIAAIKGGAVRREKRLQLINEINLQCKKDLRKITKREFWLMGIMLYWAEGSKEKEYLPGSGVSFTNSDPYMIKLFLKWLIDICHIPRNQFRFEIYIHENSKNNITSVINYWSKLTGFEVSLFSNVYLKKNKIKTKRKNTGVNYYGVLKIKVKASSTLNRKIAGWIKAVVEYFM